MFTLKRSHHSVFVKILITHYTVCMHVVCVCMYVCMCVCISLLLYVCMCMYLCMYVYVFMYVCMCISTYGSYVSPHNTIVVMNHENHENHYFQLISIKIDQTKPVYIPLAPVDAIHVQVSIIVL